MRTDRRILAYLNFDYLEPTIEFWHVYMISTLLQPQEYRSLLKTGMEYYHGCNRTLVGAYATDAHFVILINTRPFSRNPTD